MGVKVHVVQLKGRPYGLRWIDPVTHLMKQKSAGTTDRDQAEAKAKKLSEELSKGKPVEELTWRELRDRFEAERVVCLAKGTRLSYRLTFKSFEEIVGPIRLRDINASVLSKFQMGLRARGQREITIAKHTRELRAALQWAYDLELIDRVPKAPKIGRGSISKKMKGRPLTQTEFDKYLEAIKPVVGREASDAWTFFAKGLWFQGLRVNEALHLSWDRQDLHRVDLTQKFPVIWIRAELEKGKKNRMHPIAPEFAAMLEAVPESQRTGDVFKLPECERCHPEWLRARVSHIGMAIGKKAGVVVSTDVVSGKHKFASFHDLRRSCALRWAAHLMPQELMEFMRHTSLQVTLDYYVGQRALETAGRMWEVRARPDRPEF